MSHPEPSTGSPSQPTLVPRLLAAVVRGVCQAPRLVLALIAISVVVCIWLAATRLDYRTHRDDLLSPDKEVYQRWKSYLREFGQDDDMVVVVQGNGPDSNTRMIAALETLAARIHDRSDCFDRLFYKVDLRPLRERALLFLPTPDIELIREDLARMRPLLENPFAWTVFSFRAMVGEATERLKRLQPGEKLKPADVALLEQVHAAATSARATIEDPTHYVNPWSGLVKSSRKDQLAKPQYFLSGDGQLAFLLVRPRCETDGFIGPRRSVEALRQLVADVRPSFDDLRMGVTGLPVLETDEMLATQSDTTFASWLALIGVALLYLLVFRGLRAPLLTVSTLLVGTVWALGWTTLTVGHLNLLSATFAIMLIGMGDYGVLWVTHYRQERSAGLGVSAALRATSLGVGPSIMTAGLTAGLAFFATIPADFLAVAELGWIAGSGVLLCALACFTFLPALIAVVDGRKDTEGPREILPLEEEREALVAAQPWLPGIIGRPRLVLTGGAVLLVLLAVSATQVKYDHNLLNLQSESLDSVRWERTLIHHTAGASWHAVSHTATREEALALKERFEKLATVSQVVEVASLVPSEQDIKLPMLADIQARLKKLPTREKPPMPLPSSPSLLSHDLRTLSRLVTERNASLPTATVGGDLTALADKLDTTPDRLARERLNTFEKHLLADLNDDLHRLREVSHPSRISLDDLPPELRERYVSDNGRWLLRVFGRDSLWEFDALERFTASLQTVDPGVTGKPFTTLEGLRAMKRGFEWAGIYACLAILVVLFLDFRSLRPVLLALGPLVVGVLLALGAMALCGWHLNPANMIALPLIVGVGVDNGVHVLHDYLGRRRGSSYTLCRATGTGILVAGLTTLLGFGTLMLSSHRGLAGLGLILSLGVAGSMLTALILLPAGLKVHSERATRARHRSSLDRAA